MSGKKRILIMITLTCLFLFMMTGCQKKESGIKETGQEAQPGAITEEMLKDYDATFMKLKTSSTGEIYHARAYGDKIFYLEKDPASFVSYVRRVDANGTEGADLIRWNEEESEDGKWSVLCFDLTKDGNLLAILGRYDMEDQNVIGSAKEYALEEYDQSGTKQKSQPLDADVFPSDFYGLRMGVDGDGNVVIASNDTMIFVSDGKKRGEFRFEGGIGVSDFARSTTGSLYVSVSAGASVSVQRVDFDARELRDADGMPAAFSAIGEIADGAFDGIQQAMLVSNNEGLYCVDLDQKKAYKIADWEACGIQGNEVRMISIRGEKTYVYTLSPALSYELAILTPKKEGEAAKAEETKVIRFAVFSKPTILANIVSGYNKAQKKYRVQMIDYSAGNNQLTIEDKVNRMVADVLGENPPDLLDMTHFFDGADPSIEDFLNQGYVDDLTPWLKKSEKIGTGDFLEKAMEVVTFEKGVPAIPCTVMIDTLIASEAEFGKRMGWTIDEFIAYDKAHPDRPPRDHCTRDDFYNLLIYPNLEAFVDLNGKKASFDSPTFRKMLEYAHSYPVGDETYHPYTLEQFTERAIVETVFDVQLIRNRYFGKRAQYVGYPSIDGKPLFFLKPDLNGATPAICSRSQEKEGAWDFIEYVLSQDPNTLGYTAGYTGIPTNKKFLQENIEALADENGILTNGAYPLAGLPEGSYDFYQPDESTFYFCYPFTEEEEEILNTLLNGATVRDQRINAVWTIVYQEIGGYFAEQKTLDQTIDIIQNRVQLYLNE